VVPLARAFGVTVVCTTGVSAEPRDPDVRFVELPDLLSTSE
jgi:D-3-phosphoglycerate dehydrogenase/(S)-sulfolactate dehydrogenase